MQQQKIATAYPLEGVVIGIAAWNAEAATPIQEMLRLRGALIQALATTVETRFLPRYDVVIVVLNSEQNAVYYERDVALLQEIAERERTIALLQEPLHDGVMHLRDFVLAPFRPDEVVARILRVLDEPRPDMSLLAGNLELLPSTREVYVSRRRVELTFLEFEVLRALLTANGAVVSRLELSRLIDHNIRHESRAMDIHVHRLRLKLPDLQGARLETVRGAGYRVSRAG